MSSQDSAELERSVAFIRRLSWSMQAALVALFAAVVVSQFFAAGNSAPTELSAVTQQDQQVLQRLKVAFYFVLAMIFVVPFLAARNLPRRKNWARIIVIAVLGFACVYVTFFGGVALLSSLGIMQMSGPANATSTFQIFFRVFSILVGFFALAFGYLLWHSIKRLCSQEVASMYHHG